MDRRPPASALEGPFIRGIDCCRRAADHPSPGRHRRRTAGDAEWSALLARVLASEAQFQPSATHDARADYRHSLVLNPPPDLVEPVVRRVRSITPDVLPELRVQPITVGVVEAQVTASIDGSFFGVHTDADRVRRFRSAT